jgi:hypothetical protein
MRYAERRLMHAALNVATPFGVIPAGQDELLEQLQEQIEATDTRQRKERQVSRATRRFIAGQPKRLVNLDAIAQPPGQPAWESSDEATFAKGLPRQFTNNWTTRYDVRRA